MKSIITLPLSYNSVTLDGKIARVTDESGRFVSMVVDSNSTTAFLDLSMLSPGLYTVEMLDNELFPLNVYNYELSTSEYVRSNDQLISIDRYLVSSVGNLITIEHTINHLNYMVEAVQLTDTDRTVANSKVIINKYKNRLTVGGASAAGISKIEVTIFSRSNPV